jgi:Arabinose-binding domain of AraC transcription regulator, N-term
MGHDGARLAEAVGLDEAALNNPDARVPMRVAVALLARAAEQAGDPTGG